MFCLIKEINSISCVVIAHDPADAIFEKENLKQSRDHPMGEGMLGNYQQNSDIVILCIYFLSNIINYCKNI